MRVLRHLRRRAAMVPILIVHAGVLALVALAHGSGNVSVRPAATLRVFSVAPPAPQASRPSGADAATIRREVLVPSVVAIPVSLDDPADPAGALPQLSDAVLGAGEACDIMAGLQARLRADAEVHALLARLPDRAHSVANAVMLWDGRWIAPGSRAGEEVLRHLRAVTLAEIAAAPASCREEQQVGPALMQLPGQPDRIVVVGSGRWRWIDMYDEAAGERPITIAAPEVRSITTTS